MADWGLDHEPDVQSTLNVVSKSTQVQFLTAQGSALHAVVLAEVVDLDSNSCFFN